MVPVMVADVKFAIVIAEPKRFAKLTLVKSAPVKSALVAVGPAEELFIMPSCMLRSEKLAAVALLVPLNLAFVKVPPIIRALYKFAPRKSAFVNVLLSNSTYDMFASRKSALVSVLSLSSTPSMIA